jgi:hypothetical protein
VSDVSARLYGARTLIVTPARLSPDRIAALKELLRAHGVRVDSPWVELREWQADRARAASILLALDAAGYQIEPDASLALLIGREHLSLQVERSETKNDEARAELSITIEALGRLYDHLDDRPSHGRLTM